MGAARFWDDPDADLERTLDVPIPPTVRARFEPTPREFAVLREVIDALRLVGVVLAVGGAVVAFTLVTKRVPMIRAAAAVAGLVATPGVLYLIAAAGLTRRRHWAWVMSLFVTILLMLTLFGVAVYSVAFARDARAATFLCPATLYFSMPSLILLYMVRALPVIRDAELLGGKGFHVLPATGRAEDAPPPPQAVRLVPPAAGEPTSPSPAPPAPWPPTPPRPA